MVYLDNSKRILKEDEFINDLKFHAGYFHDIKNDLEHVLIIGHTDADGYASAALIENMLKRENVQYSTTYYNRKGTWRNYFDSILPEYDKYENFAIFMVDIGSEVEEINTIFEKDDDNADVFILDHHNMDKYNKEKIRENVHVVNPTLYGYDGLKEVAGAALTYLFTKEISLKNINNAWIALIGISNDTLMNLKDYRSFNKIVLEEAASEELIQIKKGLKLSGATHENIKNALAHSIYPFIKEVNASIKTSQDYLDKVGVKGTTKVEDLTDEEVKKIDSLFNIQLEGEYIIFPKKKSLLRYAFEHGQAISITAFKQSTLAKSLISLSSAPSEVKKEYNQYITKLSKNLSLFVKTPKTYTKNVIFVDAGKRIPSNNWSDVASYSSVNQLYNSDKILFLGGLDSNIIKLSVRCSEFYPPLKKNKGVDTLIRKIKKEYGGIGGGHKLAGGYKAAPNKYRILKKNIDDLFPL